MRTLTLVGLACVLGEVYRPAKVTIGSRDPAVEARTADCIYVLVAGAVERIDLVDRVVPRT
eukprot:COSAG01_NODE_38171_length_493_cov_1.045685_1_plen_60_part_01